MCVCVCGYIYIYTVVSSTPRPHFTPGKDPVPILQESGWAPDPVWAGGKSRPLRPTSIYIYIYIYLCVCIYIYIYIYMDVGWVAQSV